MLCYGSNGWTSELNICFSCQPSEIRFIPETGRALLTDRLCASLLFGAPNPASCENGSEIDAFAAGLNTKLFPGMISFKVTVLP
jgi:hypothetical protein